MLIFVAIFVLKLIESTISTRQYQEMAFCNRYKATILALISCSLWIIILKIAILDGVWGLVVYTLAYTSGVFLGMKGKPFR
jgi:uncharacterized protein YebE (UPF0316 family)